MAQRNIGLRGLGIGLGIDIGPSYTLEQATDEMGDGGLPGQFDDADFEPDGFRMDEPTMEAEGTADLPFDFAELRTSSSSQSGTTPTYTTESFKAFAASFSSSASTGYATKSAFSLISSTSQTFSTSRPVPRPTGSSISRPRIADPSTTQQSLATSAGEPTFGVQTISPTESTFYARSTSATIPESPTGSAYPISSLLTSSSSPSLVSSTSTLTNVPSSSVAAATTHASVPMFRRPGNHGPQARGPRSLGARGRFLPSPADSLPPTLYDRTPSNPLSLTSAIYSEPLPIGAKPLNSPLLDMTLAHISPAQHLRQMKKRSIAIRALGVGGSTEPLTFGDGSHSSGGVAFSAPELSSSSPIASSPTMASSPTIPASPVMSSPIIDEAHSNPMFATSIALSVVLGLLLVGVASWAGLSYRRRAIRRQASNPRGKGDDETFSASNIAEKGLKPRPKTMDSSKSITDFRPVSILFSPPSPSSQLSHTPEASPGYGQQHYPERTLSRNDPNRRVSLYDSPTGGDSIEDLHRRLFSPRWDGSERYRESLAYSVASTLEPIEEESIRSSSTAESMQDDLKGRAVGSIEGHATDALLRPESALSTASTDSTPSEGSSHYTTASCRSSLSDISISTFTASLPETPQPSEIDIGLSNTPNAVMKLANTSGPDEMEFVPSSISFREPIRPVLELAGAVDRKGQTQSITVIQTPTKAAEERRRRARSQTVQSAKHVVVDMKPAVGRTMSLQPSKAMVETLRMMGGVATEVPPLPVNLGSHVPGATPLAVEPIQTLPVVSPTDAVGANDMCAVCPNKMHEAEERIPPGTETGEVDDTHAHPMRRPENGMKKVFFALDAADDNAQATYPSGYHRGGVNTHMSLESDINVPRSRSFPSKLLSRRKSLSMTPQSGDQDSVPPLPPTATQAGMTKYRQSEVISGSYLRRALRAIRGEESTPSMITSSPSAPHSTPTLGQAAFDFTAEIAARQAQLERYLAELNRPNSPAIKSVAFATPTLESDGGGRRDSVQSAGSDGTGMSDSGGSVIANASRSSLASIDSDSNESGTSSSSSDPIAITPERPSVALARYAGEDDDLCDQGFDDYYLDGEFGYHEEEEEEDAFGLGEDEKGFESGLGLGVGLAEFPLPAAHLPHIRVTSH